MKFTVVTLFPRLIENFAIEGLLGQAVASGKVEVTTLNPREFTTDVHHTVDDKAFGGGDGMVMKVEPLLAAVQQLRRQGPVRVVLLTPHGRAWTQSLARDYAALDERIALVCGRYAGVDQRFASYIDAEISLGDFVLSGGEVAACALIESVARLKPGVLGNEVSAERDSFSAGLLECPQFTRPREFEGMTVPAPLLSGHHENIRRFEAACARVLTAVRRPDLKSGVQDKDVELLTALSDPELKSLGLARADLKRLGQV